MDPLGFSSEILNETKNLETKIFNPRTDQTARNLENLKFANFHQREREREKRREERDFSIQKIVILIFQFCYFVSDCIQNYHIRILKRERF